MAGWMDGFRAFAFFSPNQLLGSPSAVVGFESQISAFNILDPFHLLRRRRFRRHLLSNRFIYQRIHGPVAVVVVVPFCSFQALQTKTHHMSAIYISIDP